MGRRCFPNCWPNQRSHAPPPAETQRSHSHGAYEYGGSRGRPPRHPFRSGGGAPAPPPQGPVGPHGAHVRPAWGAGPQRARRCHRGVQKTTKGRAGVALSTTDVRDPLTPEIGKPTPAEPSGHPGCARARHTIRPRPGPDADGTGPPTGSGGLGCPGMPRRYRSQTPLPVHSRSRSTHREKSRIRILLEQVTAYVHKLIFLGRSLRYSP